MDIKFHEIFKDVLSTLKVGDTLNLWSKNGLDFINAYAPGYTGGQGLAFRLLKSENESIANAVSSGRSTWAEVTEIADGCIKISVGTTSEEEELEFFKRSRQERSERLRIPFNEEVTIKVVMASRFPTRFEVGNRLVFIDEEFDFYVRNPHVSVEFLIPKIHTIAYIRKPSSAIDKVIRAHFSRMKVRAEITSPPEPVARGSYYSIWEEIESNAVVMISER